MGTEGKYGAITASGKQFLPDEPLFILRATDPLTPQAIRQYADLCEECGCDPAHIVTARQHAERIRLWQWENPQHVKNKPD